MGHLEVGAKFVDKGEGVATDGELTLGDKTEKIVWLTLELIGHSLNEDRFELDLTKHTF